MTPPLRWSRRDTLLVLLLAGLVALYFWRILTPNPADRAQFPPGDFTDQFYAFRLYEARAFAEGRFPFWSENFNSGHPFFADIQSAVLYPPALINVLWHVWAFNDFPLFALELEALFHFWLAGAFTYLFARRVLWRTVSDGDVSANKPTLSLESITRIGALTASVVFMFGGYLTSYPSLQLAILETAVWLPLALYCVDRAIMRKADDGQQTTDDRRMGNGQSSVVVRPSSFVLRPWSFAAALVLGVAALAGHPQTWLFVVAVTVVYFLFRVLAGETRSRARVVRAVASVGVMVILAVGVAAVALVPAFEYQQLSTREALAFADAAQGFPTLDVLQFILPGYASAFASPLYVGILPLWLALFALLQRGRERTFWGLAALGALVLSFGFYVFAYVVFYLFIPGVALFRQQERLAFVVSFALALLASYGMSDLLRGLNMVRARRLFGLLPLGAVIMLALLLAFVVAGAQAPTGRLAFLGDRAGLMLILFGVSALGLGLYLRGVLTAKLFAAVAIVIILFDLWSVTETANKGRVEERFADVPFAQTLQAASAPFRVAGDPERLPGHFGIPLGLEEIGGISPLRLARYDRLLGLPASVLYPLLNVGYAIALAAPDAAAEPIAQDGDLTLFRVNEMRPRAWLVGDVAVEADDERSAELLTASDPAQRAIISAPLAITPDPRAADGTVNVVSRSAERITLDVNALADGLLVVSENFYPGWRASVDGQPTEIVRTNLTLRGVPVTAGNHRVEMWYDAGVVWLGAVISLVAVAICVAGMVVGRSNK